MFSEKPSSTRGPHADARQFDHEDDAQFRQVHQQIDERTDQGLESTRNLVRLAVETEEMGNTTLVELNHQGDQIRRINDRCDSIDTNLRASEKTLTQMEKWWGLFTIPWKRKDNFEKKDEGYAAAFRPKELVSSTTEQPVTGHAAVRPASLRARRSDSPRYIRRVTNCAREDEMEDNMRIVHGAIGNIHEAALAMGNQLDEQKDMLEQTALKVETENRRLVPVTKRTDKLASWS
eukprot:m.130746 g.130746  ORF g.130746 m.130746 type:complete len:234 (-) comp22378_c0_seq2:253-954(-)